MKLIELKEYVDYLLEKHGGNLEVKLCRESSFLLVPAESVELIETMFKKEVLITWES